MSPSRLSRLTRQRLRALFRKDSVDAELSRELAFHYDHLVQELLADGLSPPEARLAARKALGNIPLIEEQCRDHRAVTWLHDLRQDAAYALRVLRRSPGFAAVAVLSLALGIGANTAILSVVDALFRGALPIPNDERLVVVRTYPLDNPQRDTHATLSDYFAWRDDNRSFDTVGVSLGHNADFGADEITPAERVQGQSMTAEALSVLGVQPALGRLFAVEETRIDTPERVIVISHRLWQRRFGGRPDILGRQVRLDRVDRTIVGVMPEDFRYPSEVTEYWIPLGLNRAQFRSPQRFFVVTARLKPGVTMAQAQADLEISHARLVRDDPALHVGWGVRVIPLRNAMFGWTITPVATMAAAVGLVLLVACTNIACLLLARGLARTPEMAVRTALGAGRARLVRQMLTESMVLSTAGGLVGVVVAWGGIRALMAMMPPPGGVAIMEVSLSARMLGVTALVAVVTGLLFGLAPALVTAYGAPSDTLKESPAIGGAGRPRVRTALVAVQIAITVVLLVGSGLLAKSFARVVSRDLHFDPDRLLTFELHIPIGEYLHRRGTDGLVPYFEIAPSPSLKLERVYEGLRALPGVESVAGTSMPILNSVVLHSTAIATDAAPEALGASLAGPPQSLTIPVGADARSHVASERLPSAAYFLVTPDFFTSIRARLRGRDFAETDSLTSQWVVIVNASAARRFWPGSDPIGQYLRMPTVPDERPRMVVGVVDDIPLTQMGDPSPVVYASYLQQPSHYPQLNANIFGRMTFMVRAMGEPMDLVPAARRVVREVDPDRPMANVVTMDQQLGSVVPRRGFIVLAVTGLALLAMLLAAIGVYGVTAYAVAQRTREIGIRVALGACAREVVLLVGGRTLLFVLLGMTAGVAGAVLLTRLLQSQLFDVTPTDLPTFGAAILLLVLVAAAAAFLPVRRAVRVNPTVALRGE